MSRLAQLQKALQAAGDKTRAAVLQGFFKTGPGQYGAGDVFLGLTVPLVRRLALEYRDIALADLKKLLASPIHEFRLVSLLILVHKYESAPGLPEKKRLMDFYLSQSRRINNWDLVDLSAPNILGDYLVRARRGPALLFKLAASRDLWQRRIAMVATHAFIRSGSGQEAFAIARRLLQDGHDLIHKATGWMLREAGKRVNEAALLKFLDENAARMPRTALRYAIERLSPRQKAYYMKRR